MIYPTIPTLTKGNFNRYQLAIATAKCARVITDEYVRQRHNAERQLAGMKDADRSVIETAVNPEYRDKKAVKIAIEKIADGEYMLIRRPEGEESDVVYTTETEE